MTDSILNKDDEVEAPTVPKATPKPPKDKAHNRPQVPTEDETPVVPIAPAAVDATAVGTTETGLKYGWQDAPIVEPVEEEICYHMGIVQARKQIPQHELGHEWACTCGQVFKVILNTGGKKVLTEVESITPLQEKLAPS